VGVGAFVAQEGQDQVDPVDLAEPALDFGAGSTREEVGFDLLSRPSILGSTWNIGHRMQAGSWEHGVA
jgi:hypothetical protein